MTATVYGSPLAVYHGCAPWRVRRRRVLFGRPCGPGIVARCSICRLFYAPCTRTPIDVAAVLEGRWLCPDCEAGR